ncbi:hypothetical protein [uncultured Finegoldia sp.]|uniref:hypothetical protein n=1 Tax=uncultured Finegoldia sp. TaxID=328009 RepID=UPI002609679B|nr:hypothetical protein [uncultured Finegoldia sp.]
MEINGVCYNKNVIESFKTNSKEFNENRSVFQIKYSKKKTCYPFTIGILYVDG